MSVGHYHELCHKYRGKAVEIRTHDGKTHRGIIHHVVNDRVILHPLNRPSNLGGFSYGVYGPGYGYGGLGWGVALGSIATLALLPLFFW
ncbi:hypothetical protein GH741_12250 [Aquibacillus halophilus]|uniref:Uncharacterized protein n=1 Tax=Aquibacillus halophilus TaxID=930132 RepID=A0A6A8DHX1_9BACI|nr:hypothetical protein [Aquibacillus halophilus]MRH43449.1 hypothetical protein [Aquibacillus halophilus]